MNDMKLTRRGKVVVIVFAVIVGYLVSSAVFSAITPAECKAPAEQLSQGCLDLLYK